jgi:hypothetical protein
MESADPAQALESTSMQAAAAAGGGNDDGDQAMQDADGQPISARPPHGKDEEGSWVQCDKCGKWRHMPVQFETGATVSSAAPGTHPPPCTHHRRPGPGHAPGPTAAPLQPPCA